MFVHSNHMDGPSLNMIHLVHISHRLGRQLVGFEIFLVKPRRKRRSEEEEEEEEEDGKK